MFQTVLLGLAASPCLRVVDWRRRFVAGPHLSGRVRDQQPYGRYRGSQAAAGVRGPHSGQPIVWMEAEAPWGLAADFAAQSSSGWRRRASVLRLISRAGMGFSDPAPSPAAARPSPRTWTSADQGLARAPVRFILMALLHGQARQCGCSPGPQSDGEVAGLVTAGGPTPEMTNDPRAERFLQPGAWHRPLLPPHMRRQPRPRSRSPTATATASACRPQGQGREAPHAFVSGRHAAPTSADEVLAWRGLGSGRRQVQGSTDRSGPWPWSPLAATPRAHDQPETSPAAPPSARLAGRLLRERRRRRARRPAGPSPQRRRHPRRRRHVSCGSAAEPPLHVPAN